MSAGAEREAAERGGAGGTVAERADCFGAVAVRGESNIERRGGERHGKTGFCNLKD